MTPKDSEKVQNNIHPATRATSVPELAKVLHNFASSAMDNINGVLYRLTYDIDTNWLCINNKRIYYARTYDTQVVFQSVFGAPGTIKESIEFIDTRGMKARVNITSMKNNIQLKSGLPKGLRYLFKTIGVKDGTKGMRIITEVTISDAEEHNIDIEEINTWLKTKQLN